ncbi:glycosyltransferase family 33 protein [Piloderma croceum F 1598]|uniref:Chitobiosyldiphosphodolichol beta-mannosyltransferase n=1 Tax=Piloderma croceum (strain F 1598) TaxID=765440 RepID=A0A0C3FKW6_PILCF|nr:glycosyltransferase family 33 protein [Piloderma croceum F 1598]
MEDKTIVQLIAIAIFIYVTSHLLSPPTPHKSPVLRSVAILVLGDIGRSPRMMYHAESFAKNDYETFLVGYPGSKPIPSLLSLPHIHFLYLSSPPKPLTHLPFLLSAPIKITLQIISVLSALLIRIPQPPEFILVQNPPSIPTLALVWLVGWLRGSKIIIDWHNLGYSILALKLGPDHLLVRISKWFEATFGRSAYAHLFVTNAMHDHLIKEWDLQGHKAVLHDRPPSHFRPTEPPEMHDLFLRLQKNPTLSSLHTFFPSYTLPYSTPFTTTTTSASSPTPRSQNPLRPIPSTSQTLSSPQTINPATPRPDRPALLITSTSWTPDEDFSLLIQALKLYEMRARVINRHRVGDGEGRKRVLPKVLMVVTGKGPLKERYMREVEMLQSGDGENEDRWEWVRCISLWLEAEDYPVLLGWPLTSNSSLEHRTLIPPNFHTGSADLGICLHSSSSALDLPMKIVDMFGCGLPVCALKFACLNELVKDGTNGLVFTSPAELSQQIERLLTSFPSPHGALANFRTSLLEMSRPSSTPFPTVDPSITTDTNIPGEGDHWEWNSWDDNWNKIVRPLVLRDANGYHDEWVM